MSKKILALVYEAEPKVKRHNWVLFGLIALAVFYFLCRLS